MVTSADHPQNIQEQLIFYVLVSTWALWLIGGLYIAGPVIGVTLTAIAIGTYFIAPGLDEQKRIKAPGLLVWLWILGMFALLIILWIGHNDYNLGTGATIKSSIGWAKGWALLAMFIMAGAVLPIRAELIHRAICRLGKYSLIILPIFLIAPYVGLPQTLWVSPLKVLGGSGSEYFSATLYTIEPGVGSARWQFFAPWSPAAGMIGLVHFLCALEEKDVKWKTIGLIASLAIMLLSQSRLALVALIMIWPFAFAASQVNRPYLWFLALPFLLVLGWFAIDIMDLIDSAIQSFSGARADSSRVRAALGRIAVERWQNEAYWFGHAVVERGPHMVEYMPIGSHHSWYGLLFVKGLSGLFALAIPLGATFLYLLFKAHKYASSRLALSMVTLLIMYSFGENLEILAYLYWPALILIGKGIMPKDRADEEAYTKTPHHNIEKQSAIS